MRALQLFSRAQEVTANNLSNLNTPGFKKDKLFYRAFQDAIYDQNVGEVETHQRLNMEAGEMEQTGNLFDFAIQGDGFFEVEYDGQRFLTRNGRFHVNDMGYLVDDNGAHVIGDQGKILIPESFLTGRHDIEQQTLDVAKDGTIRVNDVAVGRIRLMKVNNIDQLERRTHSYLSVVQGMPQLDLQSTVNQGFFETGNVNPLEEMLTMTTNMRLFESSQRNMKSTDEIIGEVTRRLGKF
jgi:flagellar basal body rod protein FlgG